MQYNFQGKVALVTGGASGLGKATVQYFAKNGAKVIFTDVNANLAQEILLELEKSNYQADFVENDVCDEAAAQNLIDGIVAKYGKLDIAVNNAGIGGKWLPTHKYPTDNFRQVMEVNLMGVLFGMRAQIEAMLKTGGGSIINVSSVGGLHGFPNNVAYCASKHAVIGISKTAGLEYAKQNIRVNAVCPVFVRTPMVESIFEIDASLEEKLQYNIPMRRYGKPDEIASVIAWLASDAASFVTATAIPIDGGFTAG